MMLLSCPQKKKSRHDSSGDRGGQAIGPPRTIHRRGNVQIVLQLFSIMGSCSWWNHIRFWTSVSISSNKFGSTSGKNVRYYFFPSKRSHRRYGPIRLTPMISGQTLVEYIWWGWCKFAYGNFFHRWHLHTCYSSSPVNSQQERRFNETFEFALFPNALAPLPFIMNIKMKFDCWYSGN